MQFSARRLSDAIEDGLNTFELVTKCADLPGANEHGVALARIIFGAVT
jgi:hypothetical protein